ncbi:hypothetical protein FHS83_001502 [Rhizomicrobium palustre]|jgi:hypothetical protein|uniref:Uncharacterized protein n=1 Tax=Rhizomicrobium palustre TaxID=189966 RepID=A0A846MXA4_9PROT|nr:hypothetical protein [Rhizomicrobium palustre]NIK88184.1 hypothetical protein [Rhizomicrobium palustre]
MAICRFGPTSDVFITEDGSTLECCACKLNNRAIYSTPLRAEMLHHMKDHLGAGHKVPPEVLVELAQTPKW